MGTRKVFTKMAAVTLLALASSACSEVNFAPANLNEIQTAPRDDGNTRTDTFFFNADRPASKVDVLFVVDNSGSMSDEQQKLSTALGSFVESLSGLDWQIGITTTDISGGKYSTNGRIVNMENMGSAKVLSSKVPDYENIFLKTILANGTPVNCGQTCASSDEQPLQATMMAVEKRNTDNLSFFRANSDFVMIALSDEDERSNGHNATAPEALVSAVNKAWGMTKMFSGYGIVIRPGDTTCYDSQVKNGGSYGTFVQRLADLTNGVTGSICDNDYGPALANIGKRVRQYATSIMLTDVPIAGTVKVVLTPANPNISWILYGQTVRLSDMPAKGTKIEVTYDRVL